MHSREAVCLNVLIQRLALAFGAQIHSRCQAQAGFRLESCCNTNGSSAPRPRDKDLLLTGSISCPLETKKDAKNLHIAVRNEKQARNKKAQTVRFNACQRLSSKHAIKPVNCLLLVVSLVSLTLSLSCFSLPLSLSLSGFVTSPRTHKLQATKLVSEHCAPSFLQLCPKSLHLEGPPASAEFHDIWQHCTASSFSLVPSLSCRTQVAIHAARHA